MDAWANEFGVAITVCDREGMILDMNDKAAATLQKHGGAGLLGKSVLDCHPDKAKAKLKGMLESAIPNCYTIEKKGQRKFIFQAPWYNNGKYCGFVELSMEISDKLPHFKRE